MGRLRLIRNPDTVRQLGSAPGEGLPQRRRFGRMRVDHTHCRDLGQVLDISASGLRVARRRGPLIEVGQRLTIEITHFNHAVTVPARIVRAEKLRGVGHVHALAFEQVNDEQRATLGRLVVQAKHDLTVAAH